MKIVIVAVLAALACGCSPDTVPQAAAAPAPAEAAPAARTTWNLEDVDGLTNGNLPLAAGMLIRGDGIPHAEASIAQAMKAPWTYYGKRVCFPATVQLVDEMPPASEMAKVMNGAGEIVALTDDGSILDMIVVGGTGSLQSGMRLDMCGMIVGKTEVPNAVGGTFTHLVMVGKLK